ncbi:MAG: 50S ribosomal protein L31 [Planctomycetes bacterium]|nr:50S ribosomal protein L31 [Planctomycetota bacterium]
MKADLHPKHHLTEVHCTCGNVFHVLAKQPKVSVDICSACHPFYTGTQKFIDTAGRVDAFTKRFSWDQEKAKVKATQKISGKAQKGEIITDLKNELERRRLFSAKREIPKPEREEREGRGGGFGGPRGGRGGPGGGRGGPRADAAPAAEAPKKEAAPKADKPAAEKKEAPKQA